MDPTGDQGGKTLVRVSGMSKRYGRVTALDKVAFSIRSNEILGLIGPNGSGKTTLFECLAGVQPLDSGTIRMESSDGPKLRSGLLFYIPDAIAPWPDQSVRWVLNYTLGLFHGREECLPAVVQDLSLEPLFDARVGALSKGQRKRLLLAIGLLAPHPVIVIDEPFEGLDLRQSREVQSTLRKHLATGGRTLFLSIHQIADAASICDRFILLSKGRVVAEGGFHELETLAGTRSGAEHPQGLEEIFLALT